MPAGPADLGTSAGRNALRLYCSGDQPLKPSMLKWVYLMDPEKTIQFILEHQAQFAVQFQDLTGVVHRVAELQAHQQEEIGDLYQQIGGLNQIVSRLAEDQRGLVQAQRELTESQRHTDERFHALIKIVDDLVRRDGSPI